ncbi:hypothetical protein CCDG5_0133 [[Clostridium] cellulosi]|uniref:Phosphotyrosine protein phosphatase I domain-containing protein n=1 Tax=[Clostridium] cellulosi TaxID=29343 RepID=A0A078KL95_9FIRM|nr:MAG: low molecular weight protein arginine phosphatase [[Clostridium] cellulosi]CDZ23277.1 hypothetical protein CCDG5_0133 [[Clostridium] cellulosi]
MKKILFVCTGNTCRSPMAEVLFNKMLKERNITDISASSAGIAAYTGSPASDNAMAAVKELGADLSQHKARLVTRRLIEESDEIYCMSDSHAKALIGLFPEAEDKIRVLGGGIEDPFGGDINVYRACRDQILAALNDIIKR